MFDFCWNLFIRVKALCPDISDDLVNSYHLLLSCVDHIYACAVMAERTDLLNEKFQGMSNCKQTADTSLELMQTNFFQAWLKPPIAGHVL